ncbi:hypothetical protein ACTVZO_07625 [Streptomyces sp. IBSNAI002]|uniref:hypothetical protein n=1 Tax=Streptomyces sp. IBSNAI002 TaxID=3457500 RepID=UPI003FCF8EFD
MTWADAHPLRLAAGSTQQNGTFETFEAAVGWMDDRSTPLPPAVPSTRTTSPAAPPVAPPQARGRTR